MGTPLKIRLPLFRTGAGKVTYLRTGLSTYHKGHGIEKPCWDMYE